MGTKEEIIQEKIKMLKKHFELGNLFVDLLIECFNDVYEQGRKSAEHKTESRIDKIKRKCDEIIYRDKWVFPKV